jgi:cytochrome c oxidase cbb3-type subunit 3
MTLTERKELTNRAPWVITAIQEFSQLAHRLRQEFTYRWFRDKPGPAMTSLDCSTSHPCFFLSVTVSALLFSAGVPALKSQTPNASPSTQERKNTKVPSIEARKAFESICAGCHGLDGRGGERGPDLRERQEQQHRSNSELLEILQKGRPTTGMPGFAALGTEKLLAILAYLRVLQGIGPASALPGDSARGEILFSAKAGCSQCHMMNGAGGFLGADLTGFGAIRSPGEIRSAILNVNRDPDPRSRTVVVTLRDGRVLTGIARNEDNFSLQLQSLDGLFHLLNKSDIVQVELQPHTPMPSNYGALLSPAELDDLVKYMVHTAERNSGSKMTKSYAKAKRRR